MATRHTFPPFQILCVFFLEFAIYYVKYGVRQVVNLALMWYFSFFWFDDKRLNTFPFQSGFGLQRGALNCKHAPPLVCTGFEYSLGP